MQTLEKKRRVAWIRIELHDDTEIAEYDGKKILVLAGESIIVCTSLPASELETLARCEWLCSGWLSLFCNCMGLIKSSEKSAPL